MIELIGWFIAALLFVIFGLAARERRNRRRVARELRLRQICKL